MMSITPMEKIKSYHSIKSFLNDEQRNQVQKMLQLSANDLDTRLGGKDNEVEFTLMIYLLGWCKSIVGFEEGIANLTDTVAADLFVETKSGKKIVIEIKSKKGKTYTISEKIMNAKMDFAQKLGAELYFATKISGYWALYSAQYLVEHKRKIDLQTDLFASEINDILGDRTFVFPGGLSIISTYSNNGECNLGIGNGEYGFLTSYKVFFRGQCLLDINDLKHEYYSLVLLYENLQDVMSNDSQIIKEIEPGKTQIIESLTHEACMMQLSHFILSPIKHMLNTFGHVYDLNQYLTEIIDSKKKPFNKRAFPFCLKLFSRTRLSTA